MAPKPPPEKPEKKQHRPEPEITPDSVPDRPEILPDDMRRRDEPETPDSLPQDADRLAPDGGLADHPIHDEPMDDLTPEDVETMIDEAETTAARRAWRGEDEVIDPRATRDFAPGSSDPLDQNNGRGCRRASHS